MGQTKEQRCSKIPDMESDEPEDSLFDNEPTINTECPDCGGRVMVWIHHSQGAGFTQAVRHSPPEREKAD